MPTYFEALYDAVVDPSQDRHWHQQYDEARRRADARAARVREGHPIDPTDEDDKRLLRDLVYTNSNGIASLRLSMLSEENFNKLLGDAAFIAAVNAYAGNPGPDTYRVLFDSWKQASKDKGFDFTRAKANRFAAAFTDDVSTTADPTKFDQVYLWFSSHGLLGPHGAEPEGWYEKNVLLVESLRGHFSDRLTAGKTDRRWLNMFVWFVWDRVVNDPFRLKKQVVKYGPPGTGKTYSAREDAKREIALWRAELELADDVWTPERLCKTVQFHPAFGYEDFIEGLRPAKTGSDEYRLRLVNGVFKSFCKEAGRWEVDLAGLDGGAGPRPTPDDPASALSPRRDELLARGEHWRFVFDLLARDGGRFGRKPIRELLPPHFLIIDEINRAELSRVFGELMYCLEYRGAGGAVATQYAMLNTEVDAMLWTPQGAKFFVPGNLYLVGTMNTIDRSVESFDFALRRRFHWQHVEPDEAVAREYLQSDACPNKDWANGLLEGWRKLNGLIENERRYMGPDHRIGHGYLMNLRYGAHRTVSDVRKALWEDSIGPLVEEYLRGTEESAEPYRKAFVGA